MNQNNILELSQIVHTPEMAARGITLKNVQQIQQATFDAIQEICVSGDTVIITRFGTFEAKLRQGRKGIDPQGEAFETETHFILDFDSSPIADAVQNEEWSEDDEDVESANPTFIEGNEI